MARAAYELITRWRGSTLLVLFICIASVTVVTQSVNLDLGAEVVVVRPETKLELPLTLSAPGEGPVSISMEIGFPTDALKFVEATPGSLLKAANAKLRAEAKAGKAGDAEQVVIIEIESSSALSSGSLASLVFTLTAGAKAGTDLKISNISRVAKTAGGQTLEARGAEGLITLVEPPAPCFFYMH